MKSSKIIIFAISFVLLFVMGFFVARAQEIDAIGESADDIEAGQLADLDENIAAEELGVGDPRILPGNPLYALKGISRGFQSFITRDPIKKMELKERFANEKLIEVKKLEESDASDERVRSAIESYGNEIGQVRLHIERIKDSISETQLDKIAEDTADNLLKHPKLLGKFMRERENIAPEIELAKKEAMKRFSESMSDVATPEVMEEKFKEAIKRQKGSGFQQFKHIEVLEAIEDFVPNAAKGAIRNAIEESSKLFEEEMGNLEERQKKLFSKYMRKTGGNEVRHLEVFDSLNSFTDIDESMFGEMEKAREETRKRVGERMENIEDETRKQIFMAHLEDGEMEDARIIKELENNLAPETITAVLDVKRKMDQKIREQFENAESIGDLDNFFREIEESPDVKMMEAIKEIEKIIPEDKKEFFEQMKKKQIGEMNRNIEQAREGGRFEEEMRKLSGTDPEQMRIIEEFEGEFSGEFGFFEDIKRRQAEGVRERFERFNEFAEDRPNDTRHFEAEENFRLRLENDGEIMREDETERFEEPRVEKRQHQESEPAKEMLREAESFKILETPKLENLIEKFAPVKSINPLP